MEYVLDLNENVLTGDGVVIEQVLDNPLYLDFCNHLKNKGAYTLIELKPYSSISYSCMKSATTSFNFNELSAFIIPRE